MLDEPTNDTTTSGDENTAPAPRRRRRAASRPAGPPVDVPAAETPAAETSAAAVAEPAVVTAQPEAETSAKRPARKRAVRKAAPPMPLPEAPTEAGQPARSAEAAEEATGVADTDDAARTTRKRTPRKRATRAQAPAGPAVVDQAPGEQPPAEVTPSADANAIVDVGTETATDAPRTRRPRSEVASPFSEPTPADTGTPEDNESAADADDVVVTAEGEPAPTLDESETSEQEETAESDDGENDSDDDGDSGEDNDGSDDGRPRRRRRRRGGRRRRRGGQGSNDDDSDEGDDRSDDDENDEKSTDEPGSGDSDDDSDNDDSDEQGDYSEGRRRRRRRRRRGDSASSGDDDADVEVVDRVREPRKKASDEVTGIDGSTRMEAKRQRRREGRAAGRRRTPILSESEFLARRESVERTMVIRQNEELSQIAVLEDDVLVEHYVDRASASSLIGNVYLGRVQNVLPSMEAAFIDIGRGRNAVLYAGEVDWDSFGSDGQQKKVEKVLKSGMPILVQVTKDPVGAKGARLTNHISLPGRYVVYSPGGHLSGISRKLADTERKRLKSILGELVQDEASVIVRTAAEGASEDELVRDVNRLKAQWEAIEKKVKSGQAPQQLYAEPDPTVRIVRDLFTEDFSKLVISGNGTSDDAYDTVTAYVTHVAPHLAERIERWDPERGDIFARHRIDEQIAKALERKVFLPSGGSLVIDRTEAMTVIDVNTGKFTGTGGNLEATVTSNNLEAAEEVVRQLRLRDIGGIIVIDFIDMVLPANRELLLRRLVECLGRDRTRHQVAEVTSLGLVQMTRKKIGTGLAEAFTEDCEHCKGRGYEIHDMPVETQAPSDGGDRGRGRGRSRGGKGRGNNFDNGNSGSGDNGNNGSGNNGGTKGGNDQQQSEPVRRKFPHPKPKSDEVKPDETKDQSVVASAESTSAALPADETAEARRVEADQAETARATTDGAQAELPADGGRDQVSPADGLAADAPAPALSHDDPLVPPLTADQAAEAPDKPAKRTRASRKKTESASPADGLAADAPAPELTKDPETELSIDVPVKKTVTRRTTKKATAKKTAAKRTTRKKAESLSPADGIAGDAAAPPPVQEQLGE
ncbi:hypothetical protein GCM10027418_20390 [Mariniluteicoccus endophyticus]